MQKRQKLIQNLPGLAVIAGIVTTSAAFLTYAWLGLFSRFYADDLCMSGLVVKKGFWAAQAAQYVTWSNRFAGMFTLSLSDYLGRGFIGFWTGLVLVLWLASLAWAL